MKGISVVNVFTAEVIAKSGTTWSKPIPLWPGFHAHSIDGVITGDGGTFGTHAKNVSEDATSPDAAYQSKDVHTNSVFENYGSDDYRLDSGGDTTNLAILDDGDDLSGTFTDDIEGQTRSTWYIGASEIVGAAPATGNPQVIKVMTSKLFFVPFAFGAIGITKNNSMTRRELGNPLNWVK